ncbi:MAG TPA: hypothetical protein VLD67_10535 [Vicinamibacterales bacterium]|nr:hypothetical protein [Vicinamibacterales bacterium]
MKSHRQALILELVEGDAITSQEQLRQLLRDRGVEATQATLSRDVRDLGLVKRAADGAYRRASAADAQVPDAEDVLHRAVAEYMRRIERSEQLLVLKTDAGQAQPLAVAIDRARLPEIIGTIGGDDTILIVCRSAPQASALAERLQNMT